MSSQKFGQTTFNTSVAAEWSYSKPKGVGKIVLLPSATPDPGVDANWVAREFFDIATALPPPNWAKDFIVPGQQTIEKDISEREASVSSLRTEIALAERDLLHLKRWLRLLYDDGVTLEEIVKEAFEKLGATVVKKSREKEDYRLKVDGYPEVVMEVKGTHNSKFNVGALRQLAGWMDEVMAEQGDSVKGMFVGNAARKQLPTERSPNLFEENNEKFARLRDIAIIRAMDLYCLAILSVTEQLDQSAFWREFFDCKGAFHAQKYWASLSSGHKTG